jgi:serine/threonine protein phosphatase PrpC
VIAYLDGDGHRYSIQVASASHSGRRSSNEDAMGLMDLGAAGLCCTLADGAGGHGHGELAAQLTVQAVLEGFGRTRCSPLPAWPPDFPGGAPRQRPAVHLGLAHAHERHRGAVHRPGQGRALWAHWGDSRLYWFRAGRMHLRTEDHSLVQQLLHAGLYEENDPRRLPNRNVLAGAIGAEGQVPPSIRSAAVALEPGDVFLLCSDGLWEGMHESEWSSCWPRASAPTNGYSAWSAASYPAAIRTRTTSAR